MINDAKYEGIMKAIYQALIFIFLSMVFFVLPLVAGHAQEEEDPRIAKALREYRERGLPITKFKQSQPIRYMIKVLHRYPDLKACRDIGFSPESVTMQDIGFLFDTQEEFVVCHFWYFHSFQNKRQKVREFMNFNGLDFEESHVDAIYHRGGPQQSGYVIHANWSLPEGPYPFGPWWARFIERRIGYGAGLIFAVTDDDQLLNIRFSVSVL